MTFPTTPITTTNLSSGSGDPSLARSEIYDAVSALNTIIDEQNTAYGVAVLDGNGRLINSAIPDILAPTGQLTLQPSNTVVKVEDILRLQLIPKSVLMNLSTGANPPIAGDIALGSDVDAGNPAICIFDGTDWKYLPLASMTTVA